MKTIITITLLCLFTMTALGQDTELTNLTSREYQKKFDELVQRGYRPVKVWSKTLGVIDYVDGEHPSFGYWATFRKVPGGTPWVARHGLDAGAYQSEFDKWVAQGYMPTDMNVACVNKVVRYNVIYDKIANPPAWVARHNINKAEFDRAHKDLVAKGFILRIRSDCATPSGRIYAALWQKK